ncbi:lysozyme [Pendulispora brunnea]|uniref:Lysozyme n=1 Tax=Pendulispora brunnea TaxID=2905690 RepID=A0ABZ2K438_9BACT
MKRPIWIMSASFVAIGCVAPTEQSESETLALGSIDHTAGSQVRLHEGTAIDVRGADALVVQTPGCDVSSHQGSVNWASAANAGAKFSYIKATEGTSYKNPYFAEQYQGCRDAGLICGAYHFALPNTSNATAQADFFVDNGGGWSADGKTLPPSLDIEYNPYGSTCYGLSASAMVAWVREFSNRVKARTNRYPTIYTSTSWWSQCTGNNATFGTTNPLWVPRYGSSVGTLPAGWSYQTIWQHADSGPLPGDQDRFNGAPDRLQVFASTPD